MASFGTDHIINPFARFAEYLGLAVASPERFRLIDMLTGLPETPLPEPHRPPAGRWILCGYGRFGHLLATHLQPAGIDLTIIDPGCADCASTPTIRGHGTEAVTLRQAGIDSAAGIIAGSDNDVNNLSIAVTAAELNPSLFVVARQNHHVNSSLFDAYRDDYTMVPSRIIAQECIAILTAPMLAAFLSLLRERDELPHSQTSRSGACRSHPERLSCDATESLALSGIARWRDGDSGRTVIRATGPTPDACLSVTSGPRS